MATKKAKTAKTIEEISTAIMGKPEMSPEALELERMHQDLAAMTGEDNMRKQQGYQFHRAGLDGKTGKFILIDKDAVRGEDGQWPKQVMARDGEVFEVVYLKIRRLLSHMEDRIDKDGNKVLDQYGKQVTDSWYSTEHDTKNDVCLLTHRDSTGVNEKVMTGLSYVIKEMHPKLRVHQIVYVWLPKLEKIARLTVKGSSFMANPKTPKGVVKFYDHFKKFTPEEHTYEFVTELTSYEEVGQDAKVTYYTTDFKKGRRLTVDELKKVMGMVAEVHAMTQESDRGTRELMEAFAQSKTAALPSTTNTPDERAIPVIAYDEEGLDTPNPDDGPF